MIGEGEEFLYEKFLGFLNPVFIHGIIVSTVL